MQPTSRQGGEEEKRSTRNWKERRCGEMWKWVERGEKGAEGREGEMRVVWWNVLADGLAESGGFVRCEAKDLGWGHRGPLIVDHLRRLDADILGLSEATHVSDTILRNLRAKGYVGLFAPKGMSPCVPDGTDVREVGGVVDGCALLWRSDRVKLFSSEVICYVKEGREEVEMLRQRGVIGVFGCVGDEIPRWIVATTHLKAKKGVTNEQARCSQIKQLLHNIKRIRNDWIETNPNLTTLIGGDFNSEPEEGGGSGEGGGEAGGESVWSVMHSEEEAGLECGGPFTSSLPPSFPLTTSKVRMRGGVEEKTTRVIDYAYVGHNATITAHIEPADDDTVGPHGLPTTTFPSDHIPVGVGIPLVDEKTSEEE